MVVAKGQSRVDLEVAADTRAVVGDKEDVYALGRATEEEDREVSSPSLTVSVQARQAGLGRATA